MDILTLTLAVQKTLRELGVDKETKETVIFPETTVDMNVIFDCPLVAGQKYTVFVDGKKYVSTARTGTIQGMEAVYIGNGAWFTGVLEEEPWVITYVPTQNGTSAGWVDGSQNGMTIKILTEVETTTPIKPEYLPGVCLPVVEIRTNILESGAICTAEESAALTAVAETKLPMIANLILEGQRYSLILCYSEYDGKIVFIFSMLGIEIQLIKNGSVWENSFVE